MCYYKSFLVWGYVLHNLSMTVVLETILSLEQSRSPSEELVVHNNRLFKKCILSEKFLIVAPKQLMFFNTLECLMYHILNACPHASVL